MTRDIEQDVCDAFRIRGETMRRLRCALARRRGRSGVFQCGNGHEAGASLTRSTRISGTEIEVAVGTVSLVHTESEKLYDYNGERLGWPVGGASGLLAVR
jgi:hypothetical protein